VSKRGEETDGAKKKAMGKQEKPNPVPVNTDSIEEDSQYSKFSAVVSAEKDKEVDLDRISKKMHKKREQKKGHTVAMGMMSIRGKEIEVMFDTCAEYSAIEEEWVRHLGLQGREKHEYPMVDAVGERIEFKGDVLVPLKFGDKVINEVMMVAPQLAAPIIVGIDVLRKCDLLLTEGRLVYQKEHEVSVQMVEEGKEDPRARLATLTRIEVPPATSITIPCKVVGVRKLRGRKVYVEPATDLLVAHGLGKTAKETRDGVVSTVLQVHITNPSFDHHTIPRGTIIGYASPMKTLAAITNYMENVSTERGIVSIVTVPLTQAMAALGIDKSEVTPNQPIIATTVKEGDALAYQEAQAGKKEEGRSILPQQHIEKLVQEMDFSERKKERVRKMLEPYGGLFTLTISKEPANVPIPHRIITEGPPIHQKLYRRTPIMNDLIDQECQKLLEQNVIRESFSPWSSPVVLAWKKDGSIRFCVDYRKVNAVTKKDKYPLPRIDEAFDALAKAKFFSTIDLTSGYHQLPVAEESKEITAFSTRKGHYEYNRVPMGMTNSPATFQRNMELILRGLTWQNCLVYVDDIIVFSGSFDDHLQQVQTVLGRLQGANLRIKPSKCKFFTKRVEYLGHVIQAGKIRPDSRNTEKIMQMPVPTTKKEMQSFLGLVGYYRRFIHQFSDTAKPLYDLTCGTEGGKTRLELKEEHKQAINTLKEKLCTYPVLQLPDFKQPFFVKPDASNYGIGAILTQKDSAGEEHPILYGSRVLTKPERNYSARERELLAMVHFIHTWRPYLLGTKFFVYSDHHSLQWLKNHKDDNPRLTRWINKLMQYEYEVIHRPGKQHNDADAMSRTPIVPVTKPIAALLMPQGEYGRPEIPRDTQRGKAERRSIIGIDTNDEPQRSRVIAVFIDPKTGEAVQRSELAKWQVKDPTLNEIWRQAYAEGEGSKNWKIIDECLFKISRKRLQLVVPRDLRFEILRGFHDTPVAGHPGQSKTLWSISQHFWWPGMYSQVMKYVRTCDTCHERKTYRQSKTGKLHSIIASRPMEIMGIDLLGPLTITKDGNQYILVLVDLFTKWIEAWAIPDMEELTIAKKLVEEFISRNGAPEMLTSDRGSQFMSNLIREICSLMGTRQRFTTAYNPRANGQAENAVKKISAGLRLRVNTDQDDWDTHLWSTLLAYRTQVTTTGHTPFFLWYLRDPNLPSTAQVRGWAERYPKAEEYVREMVQKQTEAYQTALDNIHKSKQRDEKLYNRGRKEAGLEEGDLVMLKNEAKVEKGKKRKLAPKWIGPYRMVELRQPNNARIVGLNNPRDRQLVNLDRLRKREIRPGQYPHFERDEGERQEEKMLYRIQDLVRVRGKPGKREFLVRWEGYTAKYDEWVPESKIEATDLIKEFDRRSQLDTSKRKINEERKERSNKEKGKEKVTEVAEEEERLVGRKQRKTKKIGDHKKIRKLERTDKEEERIKKVEETEKRGKEKEGQLEKEDEEDRKEGTYGLRKNRKKSQKAREAEEAQKKSKPKPAPKKRNRTKIMKEREARVLGEEDVVKMRTSRSVNSRKSDIR